MSLFATYVVHSTVILGFVWTLDRFVLRDPPLRDTAWKAGLVVSVLVPLVWTVRGADRPVAQEAYRVQELLARPGSPGAVPGTFPGASMVETARRRATVDVACFRAATMSAGPPDPGAILDAMEACAESPGGRGPGLLWLLAPVSLLLAVRHLGATVGLWRLLRTGRRLALELPDPSRVSRPRLLAVRGVAGPFAAGLGTIVLPARGLDELSDAQLRAVLAHEACHLERRDPLWQWWARLVASVLFFQPLNRLCCRRMEEVAELESDDRAYRRLGGGRALAESIALVSGWAVEGAVAPALARGQGLTLARVSRLLGSRPGAPLPMFHLRVALVVLIALTALALPRPRPGGDLADVDVIVRQGQGPVSLP